MCGADRPVISIRRWDVQFLRILNLLKRSNFERCRIKMRTSSHPYSVLCLKMVSCLLNNEYITAANPTAIVCTVSLVKKGQIVFTGTKAGITITLLWTSL